MNRKYYFLAGILIVIIAISLVVGLGNGEASQESPVQARVHEIKDEKAMRFFEEYAELEADSEPENILIVMGETKPEGYGAKRVIEGLNKTYYLQYETASERNVAFKKLREDSFLVVPNIIFGTTIEQEEDEFMSWGIKKMGLDRAIDAINENVEPENILVAVIDTGVNPEVFYEKFPERNLSTYCVETCEDGMFDSDGHGTHVIGTVTEGTPENVDVMVIRVGDATFSTTNLFTSLDYAAEQNADVISISAGAAMDFESQEYNEEFEMTMGEIYRIVWEMEKEHIDAAVDAGAIIVASSGNEGRSDSINYPASYENVISVAAVDEDYNHASFSNYNEFVDFAAPGVMINSLNYNYSPDGDQSLLAWSNGTSMATPHISAAVADLLSFNKDLTLDEVKEILKSQVIDLGEEGKDDYYGYGFVDFSDAEFCLNRMLCDEYGVFQDLDKLVNYSDAEIVINGDGFNVTNEEACMVVGLKDNEYSQVRAEAGEVVDGMTTKTYDVSKFDEVMVLLKGDGDLDGEVTAADLNMINRSLISPTLGGRYRALVGIEKEAFDLDSDGKVTPADLNIINRALISPSLSTYQKIKW